MKLYVSEIPNDYYEPQSKTFWLMGSIHGSSLLYLEEFN